MPTQNDPSNPKDPATTPGAGGSSSTGTGTGTGSGSGSAKGTGSHGGVTPDNNDKPPQVNIVAAAAVGGLVGGLVGAVIGSSLRP